MLMKTIRLSMRTLLLTVGILFCGHISAEDFMYNGIRYPKIRN